MSAKRVFDFLAAAILSVVLAPVGILLAILVRLKLGKPVLFTEVRAGMGAKPFTLYKFRSMRDLRDSEGTLLSDERRLTPFGEALRSTSLDELPELWNVLRGDMSLVGPRPLTTHYLPRYSKEQARRHEVRPGITGLAQVEGRNAISWDARFALDVHYVDHRNGLLDLKILWKTIAKVLQREDISAEGHPTMPEFMGPEREGGDQTVDRDNGERR